MLYSQTWVNDHFRTATTCLQWPPFCCPILNFYYFNALWTTTTCLQRSLFWGSKGGRCTQVWLYMKDISFLKYKSKDFFLQDFSWKEMVFLFLFISQLREIMIYTKIFSDYFFPSPSTSRPAFYRGKGIKVERREGRKSFRS